MSRGGERSRWAPGSITGTCPSPPLLAKYSANQKNGPRFPNRFRAFEKGPSSSSQTRGTEPPPVPRDYGQGYGAGPPGNPCRKRDTEEEAEIK